MNKKSFLRAVSVFIGFAFIVPMALQAAVPNLIGTWTITTAQGVTYSNVLDPLNAPTFSSEVPAIYIFITDQQGRAFAGYTIDGHGNKVLIVGVIQPDNSMSLQTHNTNSKQFFFGKYSVVNSKPTFKGYFQGYEDVNRTPVSPSMEAAYFEMRKTSTSVPAR
jgi:hypothetical protein